MTALDEPALAGPTAIAFVTGDPVEAAKGLRDFAQARTPRSSSRAASSTARPLTADEITELADLESREVLLAKLAGAMKASLTKAAYLFAAPLSQAARTIDALRLKRGGRRRGGPDRGAGRRAGRRRSRPTAAARTSRTEPAEG